MDVPAAHAMIRFGLGRRGAELPPADPAAWLVAQLDGPDTALDQPGQSTADALVALREDRSDQREGMDAKRVRDLAQREWTTLADTLLTTTAPFRERLVWLWANHFTISLRRNDVTAVAMPFIREAIRPHVTGRFVDMLLAVMRHPAMLTYLDNAASFGPTSQAGRRTGRGLNENLARECLELHTVTPAAGYTQADVTVVAGLLTGWSFEIAYTPPGFLFRATAHEPGPKTVLGCTFPPGIEGGIAALMFLADHPCTHRSLATRLVRHFVADDPPTAAVRRIEAVLRDSGGNLKAAALEVTRLPEAWQPLTKLRTPADYAIAVIRALDPPATSRPDLRAAMATLGQPWLTAPLPNGWPDTAAGWTGGEAMLRRIDWVWNVCAKVSSDPELIGEASLGPLLSAATRVEIRRTGPRREALAVLLTAPEFQRR